MWMVRSRWWLASLVGIGLGSYGASGCDLPRDESETGGGTGSGTAGRNDGGTGATSSGGEENNGGVSGGVSSGSGGQGPGGAGAAAGAQAGTGGTGVGGSDLGGNAGSGGGAPTGAACELGRDCASTHCANGVCCATVCADECTSCLESDTGEPDGTCAAVIAGTDPNDDCSESSDDCGEDGDCDGDGSCRFPGPDTECAPPSCEGGQYTPPAGCDGLGGCAAPTPLDCDVCDGDACVVACASNAQCPTGFYCAGTECAVTRTEGARCSDDAECTSGSCADGVCCDEDCDAICTSCIKVDTGRNDGTCANVKESQPHGDDCEPELNSTCGLSGACDGAGACQLHVEGTWCVTPRCPYGSNILSPGSTCDGAGTCVSQGDNISCGNFTCNGQYHYCKTVCFQDEDCWESTCVDGVCM
jgi:hypothetical protein